MTRIEQYLNAAIRISMMGSTFVGTFLLGSLLTHDHVLSLTSALVFTAWDALKDETKSVG